MNRPCATFLTLIALLAVPGPADARLGDALGPSVALARHNEIPEATFFVYYGRVVGEIWKAYVGNTSPLAEQYKDDPVPHCAWAPAVARRYRDAIAGDLPFERYAPEPITDAPDAPLVPAFQYAGEVRVRYSQFCGEATETEARGDTDEIQGGTTEYWEALKDRQLNRFRKYMLVGEMLKRLH